MANLINILSRSVDRPVIDRTGLQGAFAVRLEWAQSDGAVSEDGLSVPAVFEALKESAGLQLVSVKDSVSVLVVDKASRRPTGN